MWDASQCRGIYSGKQYYNDKIEGPFHDSRNLCLNRVFLPFMSVVYGPRNCTVEAAVDFAEVVVVRCHTACQEAADTLEAS